MGDDEIAWLADADRGRSPRIRLSVAELLPRARWPQQIEIRAGKHFVRPRYEVVRRTDARRIAHPNVERDRSEAGREAAEARRRCGQGLSSCRRRCCRRALPSLVLPTPMSTRAGAICRSSCAVYDTDGRRLAEHSLGNLKRSDSVALDARRRARGNSAARRLRPPGAALRFRRRRARPTAGCTRCSAIDDRETGHAAETSFGAHVFNTLVTYRDEPQSYKGPPPGLSTRLFLRVGATPHDTLCHLIYPASLPWHAQSDTALILMSRSRRRGGAAQRRDRLRRLAALPRRRDVRRRRTLARAGERRPRRSCAT